MEGDEAGALETEDADAMLEGLCKQADGVYGMALDELVTDHVAEFGTEATAWRLPRIRTHHRCPGPAVPAPLSVDPYRFTLRVFGGEIASHVQRPRWAATCGHCKKMAVVFLRVLECREGANRWV